MNNILLPIFYLPPVQWFAEYLDENNDVVFEEWENFPKQTYRNRTEIYGANGKLALIIPTRHTGNRLYKETEISYAESWQKLHWKSIKTAYQSSPYFEFYEHQLEDIYSVQPESLMEFNLRALNIILKILKTDKSLHLLPRMKENLRQLTLEIHFQQRRIQTQLRKNIIRYFRIS